MDDPAFAPSSSSPTTQEILLHASNHDLPSLLPYLRVPGAASVQDPETGMTPLHAVVAACGARKLGSVKQPAEPSDPSAAEIAYAAEGRGEEFVGEKQQDGSSQEAEKEEEVDIEKAKAVMKELFLSGAIWNDLDFNDETPGCLAWRYGQLELYQMIVEAGVRAELLLNLMGGYDALDSEDGEDETEDQDGAPEEDGNEETEVEEDVQEEQKKDVNSEDYLKSQLVFTENALLDSDANGVMMDWETDIMKRTVEAMIPADSAPLRILNVGFGMGIIGKSPSRPSEDLASSNSSSHSHTSTPLLPFTTKNNSNNLPDRLFRATSPSTHHIIEAHPSVLTALSSPTHDFGPSWQSASGNTLHAGKWQTILPALVATGAQFDIIYFDTFGESYAQLRLFFSEYVIALLSPGGKFGFFNGLGADRKVCYDVYSRVVELDLCDAGLDTSWIDVPVRALGAEGEGEWKGVRRRYWVGDTYRLPVCEFLG